MRLIDLVSALGLEQPTVHRMLKSLAVEGLVSQDLESKRYFLGPVIYEFGLAASHRFDLRTRCEPILQSLAAATGDTVFLAIRSGDDVLCLDRKEGAYPIKIFSLSIGDRRPLGIGATGLALLAALPDEEIRQQVSADQKRLAEAGERDSKVLMSKVAAAKRVGYVLRDLPGYEGIRAIGVAVRNARGEPVAAVSVSTLVARLSGSELTKRVAIAREHASALEKLLYSS